MFLSAGSRRNGTEVLPRGVGYGKVYAKREINP
jgi:hypothetical protein